MSCSCEGRKAVEYTPTLVPPDGLFEPPYPNEAPSFPIFEDVFTASETTPLEVKSAPIAAVQQYSPPRTTPQTTTTTTATMLMLSAPVNKTKPKMSKLSSRGNQAERTSICQQLQWVTPSFVFLLIHDYCPIIYQFSYQGFECGRVDLNGFLRLGAFLDALNQVNSQRVLKDTGLSLGAVIIDSCSSDLRTVADLFELLSGTNIQKSDVVAVVRDDGAHLPNVDQLARHLNLPVVNTFFSTSVQVQLLDMPKAW
ncbi:hypothetical protein OSTOST_24427, partial [Ostertagia ostertagi]